jgi:hypothetical protein
MAARHLRNMHNKYIRDINALQLGIFALTAHVVTFISFN